MKKFVVSLPKPCSESWDGMTPRGCDRHCDQCATTVHDLRNYAAEEVEELLKRPERICVRAEFDSSGTVRTRQVGGGARLMVALGAGLSVAACSHDLAITNQSNSGSLVGYYDQTMGHTVVKATLLGGKTYKTRVGKDGTFVFKRLPAGTYDISYSNECEVWEGEAIVVEAGKVSKISIDDHPCIWVGMLEKPASNG